MKLLTALLILSPTLAHAQVVKALFGTQRFTPTQNHLVTGPLVQLQTQSGATLSFQQGAQFRIDDNGTITLASGNLRIGPVASSPLTLTLPQGPVTVAPNTALTITAHGRQSTGRIYHGEITADGHTFTHGQGFVFTPSGARGTFSPAASQAPAFQPTLPTTEPVTQPHTNILLAQATQPQPQPEAPLPTEDPTEQETQPQPEEQTPAPETPTPPISIPEEEPAPETEQPPAIPQPEPDPQPEPHPEPQPEPEQEPEVLLPTPVNLNNMLAVFSEPLPDTPMPDNTSANASTFRFNSYTNGQHTLQQTETTTQGFLPIRLSIGTALEEDTFSLGSTAGLGRWVGGELVRTANRRTSLIPNFTATPNEDDTSTITPNSLHYVWGEKATNAPTSGRITYNLAAATPATYTGDLAGTAEGTFTGTLAIDFTSPVNSVVGAYHFNGTVTMPQTATTDTGPTTTQTTYHISTVPEGSALSTANFANLAALNVTAPAGAAACPSGCTGTVNAAGFGNGMPAVGTLYSINPNGSTGITGAALFTTPSL